MNAIPARTYARFFSRETHLHQTDRVNYVAKRLQVDDKRRYRRSEIW
jgi:hypothetical protein